MNSLYFAFYLNARRARYKLQSIYRYFCWSNNRCVSFCLMSFKFKFKQVNFEVACKGFLEVAKVCVASYVLIELCDWVLFFHLFFTSALRFRISGHDQIVSSFVDTYIVTARCLSLLGWIMLLDGHLS